MFLTFLTFKDLFKFYIYIYLVPYIFVQVLYNTCTYILYFVLGQNIIFSI